MRTIVFAAAACLSVLAVQASAHEPQGRTNTSSSETRTCRVINDGVERACTPEEDRQAREAAAQARRTVEEMRPQIERAQAIARGFALAKP